jgi:hypothetical protein
LGRLPHPRHWNLYTTSTLARQLKDAGLEPVATMYRTGHSFWMYSMHHRMRFEGKPHPRLVEAFRPDRQPGVPHWLYDPGRQPLA